MKRRAAADVVIFGGGIAGLWLLNRLRHTGLSAILFESNTLGGGQTHKSQGIIHGGLKYALQGFFTGSASALVDMPQTWQACLSGKGEIDLSGVPVLASHHYLWAPNPFTAKFTRFLASNAFLSKVEPLAKADYPEVFQHPAFKGEIMSLDEMVIDVPSLVRELVKYNQDAVFKIEPLCEEELKFDEQGQLISATVYLAGKAIEIFAQQFIFAAGLGNEIIIKKLNNQTLGMQRRPLHMVMVKTPFAYPLYAHCLGFGARPRLTVTTHHTQDGSTIWYVGGQLAEDGVNKKSSEQIKAARAELVSLFPWLNFADAQFATFKIDRAEPHQKGGGKPDTAYAKAIGNMVIAWPTKLALAPRLAEEILQHLQHLHPQMFDIRELRAWPMPPLAKPVWEDAFCVNVH